MELTKLLFMDRVTYSRILNSHMGIKANDLVDLLSKKPQQLSEYTYDTILATHAYITEGLLGHNVEWVGMSPEHYRGSEEDSNIEKSYIDSLVKNTLICHGDADEISDEPRYISYRVCNDEKLYEVIPTSEPGNFIIVVRRGFLTDVLENKLTLQTFLFDVMSVLDSYKCSGALFNRLYLWLCFLDDYFTLVRLRSL